VVAAAADSPTKPIYEKVELNDIPLDDLAESYFSSVASPARLRTIISEAGIARVLPARHGGRSACGKDTESLRCRHRKRSMGGTVREIIQSIEDSGRGLITR
jgi:hypothetical protein